jgi:hypothetical protein
MAGAPKHIKKKATKVETPVLAAGDKLVKLAKEQTRLQAKVEKLKKQLSEAQGEYDRHRKEILPAAMESAGITSFKGKSGGRIHLRTDTFVNVSKEDKKKLHTWLKRKKMGDLIQDYVFPNTLKASVKNMIEEGVKLPDFIKTHDEVVAVLTKPSS